MKRLLFFILLCANVLMAQGFSEGGLGYVITGAGEVEVNECSDSVTSLNIPSSVTHTWKHYSSSCHCYITDSVRTYSVTSIGNYAFENCSSLTSVTIPNSVTSIGVAAFSGCSSLTSVTIGNSVTSIAGGAFRLCSSLTSVTIPNSVTSIGNGAFEDCSSLTSIDIPNSVTYIDDYAFVSCSSLTSVTIGNSVDTIGYGAFAYCDSLTSVNIPNSDIILDFNVFYDSGPSKYITIDSINYAVYVPPILLPFTLNSNSFGIWGYGLITFHIGDTTYRPTKAYVSYDNINISGHVNILSSIEIAGNTYPVTSIGSGAFEDCSTLTSVTIPNSVTKISYDAFRNCSSLTSVNIPNSVTSIGSSAFSGCSSLTSVNIGNSVTSIEEEAFRYCSSLTSVTIPNSVDTIGNYAFCGCPLTSITFLANNTYNFSDIFCISSNSTSTGSPITLYVPNGCRDDYENWENYVDCIIELNSDNSISNLEVNVNNEEWGSVEVDEECGTATLTAVVENDCSEFLHWSDGNTDNPRVVNVVNNPSFTAIFKDPVLDTIIDVIITQGETYNLNGQELSEEGVYNATVLSVLGCEINLTLNLYVVPNDYTNGETSSLQETELEEIVFYPNPTKGLISFSKTIERIEVVDIRGKILLSFSNVREINIGDLPAGSYLLRLHSNENSVLRKIVKE